MRLFLKITASLAILLFLPLLILELAVGFWYKSEIVSELNDLADENIDSFVEFKDIELSALKNFPHVTVSVLELSMREKEYEILWVEKLSFHASLLDLYEDNYALSKLEVIGAKFFAPIDSLGNKYMIRTKNKKGNRKVLLDIPKIEIRDALIVATNEYKGNRIRISIDSGDFRMRSFDDLIEFKGNAAGKLDTMISKGSLNQTAVPIAVHQATFRLNTLDNRKLFDGILQLHEAQLKAYGLLRPTGNGNLLDITLEGDEARINDYLALIPQFRPLKLIQLNPDAKLTLTIRNSGFVDPVTFPNVDILFELEDAAFSRLGLSGVIDSVNFRGHFSNGKERNAKTSQMVIDFGRAKVGQSFFEITGSIRNFDDPYIDVDAQSIIELADMNGSLGIPDLDMSGTLVLLADIEGKLSELEEAKRSKKRGFNGQIELKNVWMKKKSANIKIEELYTQVSVKNTQVDLTNLRMKFNDATVSMQGRTNNFLPLIEQRAQNASTIDLTVDIHKLSLMAEDLDNFKKDGKDAKTKNKFEFPNFVQLNCDVSINKLAYEKYKAKKVNLELAMNKDSLTLVSSHFLLDEGNCWIKAVSKSTTGSKREHEIWVKADFAELDADKYWPAKTSNSSKENAGKPADYSNLTIHADLKLNKVTRQPVELNDVHVLAELRKGYLEAKKLDFQFPFGKTKSSLQIDLVDSIYRIRGISKIDLVAFDVDSLKNYYNQIKPKNQSKQPQSSNKSFSIDNFIFNVSTPKANYRHYEADRLVAQVQISNNKARLNRSAFEMFDGNFELSGQIRRTENKEVRAFCDISASNINLGKVTSEFGGTNSEMFSEQHFKGNVGVDGKILLEYNKELIHQEDKLLGKVNIALSDGELINFKPITESLKFIKQANRDTILLANPNLEILIHNDEVLLPLTTFKTSLTNIDFFGYHSSAFDFGFDLQISVADLLFKSQKKKRAQVNDDKEASMGAIKHHLEARTVDGKMQIKSMKKKTYNEQLHRVEQRYLLVDSILNQMSEHIIK